MLATRCPGTRTASSTRPGSRAPKRPAHDRRHRRSGGRWAWTSLTATPTWRSARGRRWLDGGPSGRPDQEELSQDAREHWSRVWQDRLSPATGPACPGRSAHGGRGLDAWLPGRLQRGGRGTRRAVRAERRRHDAGRADDHRARHRRAEGPAPARHPARRRLLVPGLQRARLGLGPGQPEPRRRPGSTAAGGSTGPRSGRPTRTTRRTACCWPAPTPPRRSTGHHLLPRADGRVQRPAAGDDRTATPSSTRCSSTTCSSPTTTCSAGSATAGPSRSPPSPSNAAAWRSTSGCGPARRSTGWSTSPVARGVADDSAFVDAVGALQCDAEAVRIGSMRMSARAGPAARPGRRPRR